ncbi:type I DNA topoisomerase, partial [Candidatus Microgenomates bacterium]|nr:type I DNA topoisomerase [Candidatus Microgenomates bacterium]
MNLVIVESPTKARTLSRFLGSDYQIEASMGHVMDLPKSTLGVDVEHNFEPEYVTVKGKEKIIAGLKAAAKKADTIILATDPDREGEAIAHHVREILPISNTTNTTNKPIKRIVFHEITKEAIEEAIKNPRDIDGHLVDAQTARRVLDRLVGYKLSPLLWMKVRRGLSAGRVQSVAVRLIVEREREIDKFEKKKYWTIVAKLLRLNRQPPNDASVEFELIEINGVKIEEKETFQLYDGEYSVSKTTIDVQEKADEIVASLSGQSFTVADILQKEMRRSPYAPFTTSTLQQEASRRLGFSSKKTMQIAQKLYEEGFITYHRTDSVAMANQAVFAIISFIEKEYGKKYVNAAPRMFKAKQKLAQEAHEAIRPTKTDGISNFQFPISNAVGKDGFKLYELIWRRAVASQMSDAVLESTTIYADAISVNQNTQHISVSESQQVSTSDSLTNRSADTQINRPTDLQSFPTYRFKANGSVVVFDG